ncbi:MAG: gamma carbonic anhydrase family protein [Rubrivivax sp.]|nr:gamma carbonic anhydrase family protein [Rubrivivax sp.]
MAKYRIQDKTPCVAPTTYLADEATVIGEVTVGENCSVWPAATIRGDNEPVTIGAATNVQEGAVLHTDPGFPLVIGDNVTVGHQAMLHGCAIGDGSLIGIQAIVLNGAVIGRQCLVAAGALVTEKRTFPDRSLIVGAPAVAKRALTEEELQRLADSAKVYSVKAQLFRNRLERVD